MKPWIRFLPSHKPGIFIYAHVIVCVYNPSTKEKHQKFQCHPQLRRIPARPGRLESLQVSNLSDPHVRSVSKCIYNACLTFKSSWLSHLKQNTTADCFAGMIRLARDRQTKKMNPPCFAGEETDMFPNTSNNCFGSVRDCGCAQAFLALHSKKNF